MLKKRPIAVLIAAVLIFLSTIFSAHRTLGAKSREVSDSFNLGVYDKDWDSNRRSISSQLLKRCEAANTLLSVSAKITEAEDNTKELREKRSALMGSGNSLTKASPHELYELNEELTKSFDKLSSQLDALNLSRRDKEIVEESIGTFKGAQSVIASSGYNELVREFDRTTLNVFPANILKDVAFVKTPELFE